MYRLWEFSSWLSERRDRAGVWVRERVCGCKWVCESTCVFVHRWFLYTCINYGGALSDYQSAGIAHVCEWASACVSVSEHVSARVWVFMYRWFLYTYIDDGSALSDYQSAGIAQVYEWASAGVSVSGNVRVHVCVSINIYLYIHIQMMGVLSLITRALI